MTQDTYKEKSNGAGDKVWREKNKAFILKCEFLIQKSKCHSQNHEQHICFLHSGATGDPWPYINHILFPKLFSTIYQVHHLALNCELVSFWWQEQTYSGKPSEKHLSHLVQRALNWDINKVFPFRNLNDLLWIKNYLVTEVHLVISPIKFPFYCWLKSNWFTVTHLYNLTNCNNISFMHITLATDKKFLHYRRNIEGWVRKLLHQHYHE